MLRFDIPPICANAYRIQALVSFIVAAVYLFTPYQWVSLMLALGGFIRGFISPHQCLSYRLFSGLTGKFGIRKLQNAGSKMFADKVVSLAGIAMTLSWVLDAGFGVIPGTAILIFACIDLLTGFCAACWAYGAWYRLRGA